MSKQNNELVLIHGVPAPPADRGAGDAALTLRQAVTAIFRSRLLLGCTTLAGLLLGAWFALNAPNRYVSEGTFLFRPGGEEIVIDLAGTATQKTQGGLRSNAGAILRSEDVLRRTVRRVGASEILAPYSPRLESGESGLGSRVRGLVYWFQRRLHGGGVAGTSETDALLALADRLDVEMPDQTQLVLCRITANNPKRAQRILTVFMEEAQARHLEVYSASRSMAQVKITHESAVEAHQKATLALKAFLAEHGLDDYDTDLALAKEEAAAARREVQRLRSQMLANKPTLAGLRERLKSLQPTVTVTAIVPVPKERVPVLRGRIAAVETELLDRQRVLRPTDELIQNLQRELVRLEKELDEELAKKIETRTETREEPNQEYLATKQSISQIQLQIVVGEESMPGAEARQAEAQAEVKKLLRLQGEWSALSRRILRAQERLDNAEQVLALAQRKSELDENRISSLAILDRPNLPLVKEGPQRARIVLGGLLGGLFLGIAVVILRALTDRTVRTADDLDELAGMKVLATIPNLDRTSVERHGDLRVTSWS